jgi:hypothetical protein
MRFGIVVLVVVLDFARFLRTRRRTRRLTQHTAFEKWPGKLFGQSPARNDGELW